MNKYGYLKILLTTTQTTLGPEIIYTNVCNIYYDIHSGVTIHIYICCNNVMMSLIGADRRETRIFKPEPNQDNKTKKN